MSADLSPDEVKALISAPLGEQMAKFPLRFAKSLHFGLPPSRERPTEIRSGTASLLKHKGGFLAVTCAHVLEEYRRLTDQHPTCQFAIGNCYFDPLECLVSEERVVDVAVLQLTSLQAEEITHGSEGIGEAFFDLPGSRPTPVVTNEFVAFGGFPGGLRKLRSFDELDFGSYSSGACRVTDHHSDYITCEFEREHWITHYTEEEPETIRGLSSAPAFVIRHSPSGLMTYDFAGIVYNMHEKSESLYIRQAHALPLDWD